jgi:hypothetical protein
MGEPHYFCTLFDSNYLVKGLAMLRSLNKYCENLHVYVLCMDEKTKDILEKVSLDFVTCIPLSEMEDESLLKVKKDRSVAEYCWTLSPCLPWFIFDKKKEIEFITYLDADLLFYSSVNPLFEEIGDASIAIIEHRFSPRLADRVVNGIFCVEWVSFRRDVEGLRCLSRWREQCIEWCYYRLEENKMGDQKYLDTWPVDYKGCHIIKHPGAGIAPWNYSQYFFSDVLPDGILVDGKPLIFYHFHQFQLLECGKFDRISSFYRLECEEPNSVYQVYESSLRYQLGTIANIDPNFSNGIKKSSFISLKRIARVLSRVFKIDAI